MMCETKIQPGQVSAVFCNTQSTPCRLSAILRTIDKKTGETIQENPPSLKQGDVAIVEYTPEQGCAIETFAEFPPLGRIVIRKGTSNSEGRVTLAVGQVKSVVKRDN